MITNTPLRDCKTGGGGLLMRFIWILFLASIGHVAGMTLNFRDFLDQLFLRN